MAVKPMIFSGPMVKAILDGDKTMTRRVIKPQPKSKLTYVYAAGHKRYIGKWMYPSRYEIEGDGIWTPPEGFTAADRETLWTPPCHGDDILWVRETWAQWNGHYLYLTEDTLTRCLTDDGEAIKWRPSIHMPKQAARIFLRVEKVSVERLQEISVEDIAREALAGLIPTSNFTFRRFWDSLRKPADLKQYGWDANPWVWVISFQRCEKPETW